MIEKLGITTGYYEAHTENKLTGQAEAIWVESPEMQRLKDTAPEMLEALIECAELIGCFEVNEDRDFRINEWLLPIIQKATDRTWAEIKDLIDE